MAKSKAEVRAAASFDEPAAIGSDPVRSLAERLFVANWTPNPGYKAEHVAQLCFDAAEEFYQHAASRNELIPATAE